LEISATNQTFGDSWPGVRKTFVVFYQYGNSEIFHEVAFEGETFTIQWNSDIYLQKLNAKESSYDFRILKAIYGLKDVTIKCKSLVSNKSLSIPIDDKIFGDGLYSIWKSFVILYEQKGKLSILVEKQNNLLQIPSTNLTIIKAVYGVKDVTTIVREYVKMEN